MRCQCKLVLVEREFLKMMVELAHLHFLDLLSLMVVVAAVVIVVQMIELDPLVDLEVDLDKDQDQLCQELLQIRTQILRDREILVALLDLIQVLDGVVLAAEEVLAVLGLMEIMEQEVQPQQLPVVVVESVFNYHQLSKIQDLHQHQMVVV